MYPVCNERLAGREYRLGGAGLGRGSLFVSPSKEPKQVDWLVQIAALLSGKALAENTRQGRSKTSRKERSSTGTEAPETVNPPPCCRWCGRELIGKRRQAR